MSIVAPIYDKSEPRSEKLYPYHLPLSPEWSEQKDWFGQTSMMGAGAGMFLKNPMIVWGCLISSVISFVNQQPLRTPKDAQSPLMKLGMGFLGVFTISMPKMMMGPTITPPPASVPVSA